MTASDRLLDLAHPAAALGAAVAIAAVGRRAARRAWRPGGIRESMAGLLVGPALVGLHGERTFDTVLPGNIRDELHLVTGAGLVLFMVGSLLPTMALGTLLAGWLVGPDPDRPCDDRDGARPHRAHLGERDRRPRPADAAVLTGATALALDAGGRLGDLDRPGPCCRSSSSSAGRRC